MTRILSALLVALLALPVLAACGEDGGEKKAEPSKAASGKLYWRLPRRLPGSAVGQSRYGNYGAMPMDIAVVGKWLCVSALSPSSGQAQFWMRSPDGTWMDVGAATESRRLSRWIVHGNCALALSGGRRGLHLTVLSPEAAADKRYETLDVIVPEEAANPRFGYRSYYDIRALDLTVHKGKLFVASEMFEQSGGTRALNLKLTSSTDDGKTWSKPKVLSTNASSRGGGRCLALWSDGEKLHLVNSPATSSGTSPAKLLHRTSVDEGKTWKKAPALPVPAKDQTIQALRAVRGGKDVVLLASNSSSGGRVYVYRSPDGGLKWAAPLRVSAAKGSKNSAASLDSCHLALDGKRLVLGYGEIQSKRNYNRSTGSSSYSHSVSGGLLISRDGGKTWRVENYTAGLKGKTYAPLPALRADGGIDLVFGWTNGKTDLGFLGREAHTTPPGDKDARLKAEIAALVKNLAAGDYKVRERAARGLRQMGMVALPALRLAARDKDAERSLTAEHLLRKMTPSWWKGP